MSVLSVASLYLLKQEKLTREQQIQHLVQTQLQAVEQNLMQYPRKLAQRFLRDVTEIDVHKETIRNFVRNDPEIRNILVMPKDGQRLFPPMSDSLLQAEKQFLERTQDIWRDKSILYRLYKDQIKPMADADVSSGYLESKPQTIKFPKSQSLKLEEVPVEEVSMTHGWYTWFSGREMNVLFWVQSNQGELFGFELDPVRLQAELISLLPDSSSSQQDFRIQLIDARGDVLYQWGNQNIDKNQTPIAIYPLDHPLGAWKLQYFSNNLSVSSMLTGWNMLMLLLIVLLVLMGLVISIYREHTRDAIQAKQRVNFVNQVSHELKTPLTNIRLYAELLTDEMEKNQPNESPKAKQFLAVIAQESQRLSRLIHNVLDFARVEKKTLTIKPRLCDVSQLVESVLATHQPLFLAKNIVINFESTVDKPMMIDADVLEQMLNNLLSNVEKYAHAGKQVDVSVGKKDDRLDITVRDYGPGIAKADREKIFQPFYRASSKLTEGVSGTGIGLDITRSLARLHGGDVELMPTETGACFRVTIREIIHANV